MISNLQETLTTNENQHGIYSFPALLPLEKRREFNFGRGFGRLSGRGRKCKKSLVKMTAAIWRLFFNINTQFGFARSTLPNRTDDKGKARRVFMKKSCHIIEKF